MARLLRDTAIIAAVALLLFVLLNVAAWFYLDGGADDARGWGERWQVDAASRRGVEIRSEVFGTDDTAFLRALDRGPVLRAHTTLSFTSGFSTEAYTVGREGIRYEPGWTDAEVETALRDRNAVWVFGGSTVFGHGVPGDATLPGAMARKRGGPVLNFGINAYDSLREVDKLVYLLRQGYRPERVVFVDGLNDFTTFASTPYRPVDKPRTQGFLIDRGRPALLFGTPVPGNMLLAFAYALPVTHAWFRLRESAPDIAYGSLDANVDPLDYSTLSYYYRNQFDYADENIERIARDWVAYYRSHIAFVEGLAEAFGFAAEFVFQPLGVLDRGNPFMIERYFESSGYRASARFADVARMAIRSGELAMRDCSDAFAGNDSRGLYVDATHYSPAGNALLADCILDGWEAR